MPAKARPNALLEMLKARFAANPGRHPTLAWAGVEERLGKNSASLRVLAAMEDSGGEPDVIGVDASSGAILFCDCSPESPVGRRSLCYDAAALDARKKAKPAGSAAQCAAGIGIELLTEDEYRQLQTLGQFDLRSSSWLRTPDDMRARGGALFGDRRFGRVFVYHNGVESYYSGRGFRGLLRV